MPTIYSVFNTVTKHEIEHMSELDAHDAVIPCNLDLYQRASEEIPDDQTMPIGDAVGSVSGTLVLGREIELLIPDQMADQAHDNYLNLICDDLSADLGYVVSALLEDDGPLCLNNTIFGIDHFYIHEINVSDPDLLPVVLAELPKMIFTHLHSFPDILSYYPMPLPHEQQQTQSQRIMEEVAKLTQAAIADQLINGQYDAQKPHLVLTREQHRIITGMRRPGDSYPEEYINREIWQPYLDAGFHEWGKTRVLYKFADREEGTHFSFHA